MKKIALMCAAVGMAASLASAQSLVDTGFEAPGFVPGNINTQSGWVVDPAGHTQHQVVSGVQTVGAISISPDAGSQMVSLSTTGTSGSFYSWTDISAGVAGRTAGNDWVYNSFRMFVPSGQTQANWMGTTAWGATGLAGGLRVRCSDARLILTFDPVGTAAFGNYLGPAVPVDAWNTYATALNVVTGDLLLSVNGVVVAAGTAGGGAANAAGLSDFDLTSTIQSGAVSGAVAFVDGFSVNAVPTPGAAALLGLGGLAAFRRRR